MFAFRQTAFICCLLLDLIQITNGLTCYSCVTCEDNFDPNGVDQITKPDNQGYSCAKYWAATGKVIRYVLQYCTPDDVEGIGTFCCQTDLCNGAGEMISMHSLFVSFGLVLLFRFF